jgi:[ribosomal protein S5]-alanine N-acetyltransferase
MRHNDTLVRGGVVLDPIAAEHVTPEYVSWLNDPVVVANTEARFHESTIETTREYVRRTLDSPDSLMWRILTDGQHIGNIRLSSINFQHRRAAIAILVGSRSHWGRGIGQAAITLVSAHAFTALSLYKLTAGIYETNTASRRAFERAGFLVEAVLQRHAFVGDEVIGVLQMARFSSS